MRTFRRPDPRQLRARAYLLLGPVFGALWFGLNAALYIGGAAAKFLPIGVLTLVGAQLLLRPIGRFERWMVRSLLGQEVAEPGALRFERSTGSRWSGVVNVARRAVAVFRDGHSWRVLVWTLIRFVTGPVGFLLVAVEALLPLALVLAPLQVVLALATGARPVYWLLLAPLGLALLPPVRAMADALAELYRSSAVWALGPGRREIAAAARARAEAAEEQVRIDQELHDSIGHMLSMIVLQAGAGAHVFDNDPDFARAALSTIEQRGRAALSELDRIIGNLREGAAGFAPLPGGEDLPALLDGAAAAGVDLTSRIRIGDLPPAVGRGVYRIVQEALTNAVKHAPACPVTVEVAADGAVVAVSVVNPLPTTRATATGPGRGLASIRDRATLLGGAATTGRTGAGEFAVRVVLPLGSALPAGADPRCSLVPECACAGCAIRRSVLA